MSLDAIINDILAREGGYVDRPEDRGGPTKYGITLGTLAAWRSKPQTPENMQNLTEQEARAIYYEQFIVRPGFVDLKEPLRSLVVDSGVNHGPSRATAWLQRALGVKDDGVFGGLTIGALAIADPAAIYRKVLAARVRFYGRIITDNPSQAKFAAGWANRVASFIEAA